MASLKSRMQALERGRDDGEWVVLNPRYYDSDRSVTEDEWDRQNAARILDAERAGHRIIRIHPARNYD